MNSEITAPVRLVFVSWWFGDFCVSQMLYLRGEKKPQQLQFTINASVVSNIVVTNHNKLHHYTAVYTVPLLKG